MDTNNTTANTNTGFEARLLQTEADNNNAGGGAEDVKTIIPLNRYSFFEELQDKMLLSMRLLFNIELNSDNELIHKANGADNSRVVVNRFLLWIPKLSQKTTCMTDMLAHF